MKNNKIIVGDIVKSTAGRDKGNLYIVQQIVDKDFALLVDGKTKLLSKPKKKRLKHLCKTFAFSKVLADKFAAQTKVFDPEVFSAIKKLSETENKV